MLRTVSTRCRPSRPLQLTQKRFRTKSAAKSKKSRAPHHGSSTSSGFSTTLSKTQSRTPWSQLNRTKSANAPPKGLSDNSQCSAYFQEGIQEWSINSRTLLRFASFGFEKEDMQPFLAAYASEAKAGLFTSTDEMFERYQLARFADSSADASSAARLAEAEVTFSNIFFTWVKNHDDSRTLDELVEQGKAQQSVLQSLRHFAQVSARQPAEDFPLCRKRHRKIIMHVGPTNSGKTYHALRALAAARTGVYAGPLRLLAHEIWERLNLGQIAPLGVEVDQPNISATTSSPSPSSTRAIPSSSDPTATTPDDYIAPVARLNANAAYARPTNMITGEEKKIVSDTATLLSCTVEMLNGRTAYDVGVIDEIQLIGDHERGYAWTQAVLGLSAKELHLCGEESAIPIVQELLKDTGDELIVKRYQRLTPLVAEERSLDGDYSKVQKGDCVVAFSRSRIFGIKQEIEKKSGLRCAVVYGKLPPEIRSEQAALFNDPNSGYDVIIGSDAIGMGLNLKIRRIIFDAVHKTDGSQRKVPLSISQLKQIAGRAGRYGHTLTGEKPGGFATTLNENDLPLLKHALDCPTTPVVKHAYIAPNTESTTAIASALPPSKHSAPHSLETVIMAHLYSSLPPSRVYKYALAPKRAEVCAWIDERSRGMLMWEDKLQLLHSPVAWRDDDVVAAADVMVHLRRQHMLVGIEEVMARLGMMKALEDVERLMFMAQRAKEEGAAKEVEGAKEVDGDSEVARGEGTRLKKRPTGARPQLLEQLESLHKILVLYMWMHHRNTVIFPDRDVTEELKHRVEVVLDWGLQTVGKTKGRRMEEELINRERRQGMEVPAEEGKVMRTIREANQGQPWPTESKMTQFAHTPRQPMSPRSARPLHKPYTNYGSDTPKDEYELEYKSYEHQRRLSEYPISSHLSKQTRQWQSNTDVGYSSAKTPEKVFDRVPDLGAMLKMYVADPSLRIGARKQ